MRILLAVLVVLLILLLCPIWLRLRYDGALFLRVGYLCFGTTLYPAPERKPSRPRKKKKKVQKPAKEKRKPPSLADLELTFEHIVKLVGRCTRSVQRLLRRTSVAKLELDLVVAGEDAAATALAYGQVNAAVYSAATLVDSVFDLRIRRLTISPDFTGGKSSCYAAGVLRLVPLVVLFAALDMGVGVFLPLVWRILKPSKEGNKHGKQTAPHQ